MITSAVPKRRAAPPWLPGAVQALPYLCLLAAAYSVFAETVDDPYITFRYAANVLAGHGPVFNAGERVEGFTSPLHLLLSLGLLSVLPSVDILFKAKCASLLFAFAMLAQTGIAAKRSGLNAWESVLAQTLLALNINFALAGVNALETTLYGTLLLASLLVFHREVRRGWGAASGAGLFLAALARPEALLVVAALALVRVYWLRRSRLAVSFVLAWLGAFLLPMLLVELARLGYYGAWLPNTYFAKSQPLGISLSHGGLYLLRSTGPQAPQFAAFLHGLHSLNAENLLDFHSLTQKNLRSDEFSLLMPLVFWGLAAVGAWRIKRRIWGGVSLAVIAAVLLFVLKSGGDWMYGWRFVAPALPLLAVCQCFGLRVVKFSGLRPVKFSGLRAVSRSLAHRSVFSSRRAAAACTGITILLWLVSCAKTEHYTWKSAGFSVHGDRMLNVSEGFGPLWVRSAQFLHSLPPKTSVAYSEMGYAGYANLDKRLLDIRGLTDREIARLPPDFKYSTGVADKNWFAADDPLNKILERRKPDVILSFDPAPPGQVPAGYKRRDTLNLPIHGSHKPLPAYVFQSLAPQE